MYNSKDFRQLLTQKLTIFEKLKVFTDIRKNPQIKLRCIIMLIILMYFINLKSFLALDRICRKESFKKLFNCKRKMIASDSTIIRTLNWLQVKETQDFTTSFFNEFKKERMYKKQLEEKGKYRRIGIIDGTCMKNHWFSLFILHGKTEYPLLVQSYNKRGKELVASNKVLVKAKSLLKEDFPDIILLDALYFNIKILKKIREYNAHILVKSRNPDFRDILREGKLTFNSPDMFDEEIIRDEGFDNKRMCSWKIEVTTEVYHGYPVQIAHLIDHYPKRKNNKNVESWIITTDLELSPAEIREAALCRWKIENNAFKKLSHHSGTKKFYLKEQEPFINLIYLFFTALALFNMIVEILKRNENNFKTLLNGIKPTEKNIFSQIAEYFEPGIFTIDLI